MSNLINVYVTPDGRELSIPDAIREQTKFTRTGAPDSRAANAAFKAWMAEMDVVEATKVDLTAREAKPEGGDVTHNGDTGGQLERVQDERAPVWGGESVELSAKVYDIPARDGSRERAQAYAMMVWAGQSADLGRAERIARCERALIAQNLPTEGVHYPETRESREEDDDEPVTWRMNLPKPEGIV